MENIRFVCLSLILAELLCFYRQYEEKQLHSQQERDQRRLAFAKQISQLESQLAYEKQRDTKGGSIKQKDSCGYRISKFSANMKKLAASISTDESSIASLEKEEADLMEVSS